MKASAPGCSFWRAFTWRSIGTGCLRPREMFSTVFGSPRREIGSPIVTAACPSHSFRRSICRTGRDLSWFHALYAEKWALAGGARGFLAICSGNRLVSRPLLSRYIAGIFLLSGTHSIWIAAKPCAARRKKPIKIKDSLTNVVRRQVRF
jgi:hypothetical protein